MRRLYYPKLHQPGRRKERGFTLVEVIITMGLLSIFLVVLATIFTASVDVQVRSRGYSSVSSDGRYLLARLDYDIARASAVTTPSSLGSSSGSLVLTIGGSTYTYAISGTGLQLTTPAGSGMLTSSDDAITSVSFTKLGNAGGLETIRYAFTLTSKNTQTRNTASQTFTSTTERRS